MENIDWPSIRGLSTADQQVDALKAGVYRSDALSPAMTWLDDSPPSPPNVATIRSASVGLTLKLTPGDNEPVWLWSVWTRTSGNWTFATYPGQTPSIDFAAPATD